MHKALVFVALWLAAPVSAQILRDSLTVHPALIKTGSPFLLLVEDAWPDGCLGTVNTTVSPTQIVVTAAAQTPRPGIVCTQALVPFAELINPRELLPAGQTFAASVAVRFVYRAADGRETVETDTVRFGPESAKPTYLAPGSFTTTALGYSGLFVDQQDGIATTMLSDYGDSGQGLWFYGAAGLNGNVYVGDLQSYQTIECIRAPCERAAASRSGRVNLLIRDQNHLVVSYRNVLNPAAVPTTALSYRRLDFVRPANLPPIDDPSGLVVPELEGEFVGGILGTRTLGAQLGRIKIEFRGPTSGNGLTGYEFVGFTEPATTPRVPLFTILCADARPVDGAISCQLSGFAYQGRRCDADFAPGEVGPTQLRVVANCSSNTDAVETEFVLTRL